METLTLGERIVILRRRAGITQEHLARAIGIGQGDMWRIESGKTANPGWRRMVAIADALGVSLDTLAGRDNGYSPKFGGQGGDAA